MSAIVTALNQLGLQSFGLSMPHIAPAWAPNKVEGHFTTSDDDMSLTITQGTWAAPFAVLSRRIEEGSDMGITLIQANGSFEQGPGVLLTVFPQEYVRLCRLYVNVLEEAQANRPEQARGFPWRPVPRYFYFPGALTPSDKNGNIQPWDDLQRQGLMRIYDNDGLPIDVLAVANALGTFMAKFPILQATILGAQFEGEIPLNSMVTHLLPGNTAAGRRVRLATPNGQPYGGAHVQGANAVNAATGLFTMSGTSLTLAPVSDTFPQSVRDRFWIGPATSGRLGAQFQPAVLADGITLARDFFSVRVVDVTRYLLGTPDSADEGVQAEAARPIPVRINEPLSLLTDGNQVAAAAGAAIAGAPLSIVVAPTIQSNFNLPSVANSHWPAFPGVPPGPNVTVPVNLRNNFNPTAAWFDDINASTPNIDVILTLNGLPANAWVRIYPRKFLPDALEGRGDGSGALVPANGTITVRLVDPLGLRRPQDVNPQSVTIPAQATLRADVMVLLPNGKGRIFGTVAAPINSTVTSAPSMGNNNLNTATFRGISLAGILGLRSPGPIPASIAAFLQQLAATGNPRDAPRLPTMARRELIAVGRSGTGNWSAVISGGQLSGEIISADSRLGAPGGPGGRELQSTGVSTQNGRLAYDIALAGLRHARGVAFTSSSVAVDPIYAVPAQPAALPLGLAQNATQGTFAGAVLGNIAPYCEVPDFNINVTGLTITPDDIINFLQQNFNIPSGVNNILNALKTGNTGNAPTLVQNIGQDLPVMLYGRRDTQWALQSAIQNARRFIYIESPGFCSTAKDPGPNPVAAYTVDLIAELHARMTQARGLHVIICTPKYPDFSPGYEPLAAYEAADRRRCILGDDTLPSLPGARTVAFHPVGFPGRSSRIETTTIIVDDCWALVGSSSFRRRGLTFDGSWDLVFTDAQVEGGGSPAIAAFRRSILAQRLGVPTGLTDANFVRLKDGVESLYLIREMLLAGGLGRIERLWNGETPGVGPTTPAPIDQANPEGREFDLATAMAVSAFATFNGL